MKTRTTTLRYFSMFSGIGTGEKGIEQAFSNKYESKITTSPDGESGRQRVADINGDGNGGAGMLECVGYSEIDPVCTRIINEEKCAGKHQLISETRSRCSKCGQVRGQHAAAIYKYHWPSVRNFGDATLIVPKELPGFDFLIGGFPCQAFSIAGKRLGFDDTRGTLFFDIARIVREKRPRHFLLENVKGLLSHDNGNTFRTIVATLDELGYDLEWTVINSKDHGVPQNRERVFIIGHIRGGSCGQVFSIGDSDEEPIAEQNGKRDDIAHTITNGDKQRGSYDVASTVKVGTLRTHKDGEGFREMQSGLAPALNARARQDGSQQGVIMAIDTKQQKLKTSTEHFHCLQANDYKEPKAVQLANQRIRRFTPVETERLQGCPDNWTKYGSFDGEVKEISDTQRYKTTGNAMTVDVIEEIITRMIETGCLC